MKRNEKSNGWNWTQIEKEKGKIEVKKVND